MIYFLSNVAFNFNLNPHTLHKYQRKQQQQNNMYKNTKQWTSEIKKIYERQIEYFLDEIKKLNEQKPISMIEAKILKVKEEILCLKIVDTQDRTRIKANPSCLVVWDSEYKSFVEKTIFECKIEALQEDLRELEQEQKQQQDQWTAEERVVWKQEQEQDQDQWTAEEWVVWKQEQDMRIAKAWFVWEQEKKQNQEEWTAEDRFAWEQQQEYMQTHKHVQVLEQVQMQVLEQVQMQVLEQEE